MNSDIEAAELIGSDPFFSYFFLLSRITEIGGDVELLIGVSAGFIGLVLGIVGIATAFHPPQTRRKKATLTTFYVVLSAIAAVTTVLDRQTATDEAELNKRQMNELVESSKRQTEDFLKLTAQLEIQQTAFADSNRALREQLSTFHAQSSRPPSSSLKSRIESLLKEVDSFIRRRTENFSIDSAKMSLEEYRSSDAYSKFRRELSAEYINTYVHQVISLLVEAADAGAAEKRPYGMDERFVEAGMTPYIDELRDAYSKLREY